MTNYRMHTGRIARVSNQWSTNRGQQQFMTLHLQQPNGTILEIEDLQVLPQCADLLIAGLEGKFFVLHTRRKNFLAYIHSTNGYVANDVDELASDAGKLRIFSIIFMLISLPLMIAIIGIPLFFLGLSWFRQSADIPPAAEIHTNFNQLSFG